MPFVFFYLDMFLLGPWRMIILSPSRFSNPQLVEFISRIFCFVFFYAIQVVSNGECCSQFVLPAMLYLEKDFVCQVFLVSLFVRLTMIHVLSFSRFTFEHFNYEPISIISNERKLFSEKESVPVIMIHFHWDISVSCLK